MVCFQITYAIYEHITRYFNNMPVNNPDNPECLKCPCITLKSCTRNKVNVFTFMFYPVPILPTFQSFLCRFNECFEYYDVFTM